MCEDEHSKHCTIVALSASGCKLLLLLRRTQGKLGPHLSFSQFGQVGFGANVELYAIFSSLQRHTSDQQDQNHQVRECSCKIHNLERQSNTIHTVNLVVS